MFSALFSFLGGSVFRMLWGEVAGFITKQQDHAHELAMMTMQADLDQKAHERSLENIRLQASMAVQQVEVQRDATVMTAEADAFKYAMENMLKPTGIYFVDAWNGVIRPAAATIVLALWMMKVINTSGVMDEYDMNISGVVLGFFFADRGLAKRGK